MAIKTPKSKTKSLKYCDITMQWDSSYFDSINTTLKAVLYGVAEYSKDRMNEEYVPKSSGNLINSSEIELTSNDTADIKWEAPYANKVYYDKSRPLKGKRGPMWFDRMIEDYQKRIEKEANRIYKGVSK